MKILNGNSFVKFENGRSILGYGEFETINPLDLGIATLLMGDKKHITHGTQKVLIHETVNFLFEIDCEELCIQVQRAKQLVEVGIVNRAVHSGGVSVHCRITAKNDNILTRDDKTTLVDVRKYKCVWKYLNDKYFEGKADKACADPTRLTRRPNVMRSNGMLQELLAFSDCVLHEEFTIEHEKVRDITAPRYSCSLERAYHLAAYLKKVDFKPNDGKSSGTHNALVNALWYAKKNKLVPEMIKVLTAMGYSMRYIKERGIL